MDVWLPINPPICGDCGRPCLFEAAEDDARVVVPVICPRCGAKGMSARAVQLKLGDTKTAG